MSELTTRLVGARVRQLREMQGWTQKEMGLHLSPSRTHAAVSDIERGKTMISVDLLAQFSRIFDVSVCSLVMVVDTKTAIRQAAPVDDLAFEVLGL